MKSLTAVVAVILLLIVAVVVNNWHLVIQRVPVDLGVTTVDFSIALLLLIGLAIVAAVYFATIGRIRMQSAIESRDLHRELDKARRMADNVELSRIAEIRAYLDREVPQIELKLDLVLERLDGADRTTTRATLHPVPPTFPGSPNVR